jgi:hypothetical protein
MDESYATGLVRGWSSEDRGNAQRERDRANAATVRNLLKLTVSKSGPPEALKLGTSDTHRAIIERSRCNLGCSTDM